MMPTFLPAFRLIGLCIRTHPDTAAADIGRLWQSWFGSDHAAALDTVDHTVYCAYHHYEGDYQHAYSVTLGKKAAADTPIPAGCTELLVPAQHYAVYPAEGEMPQAIVDTWRHIWQNDARLPRRYQVDFDAYPADGTPSVHIGIKT